MKKQVGIWLDFKEAIIIELKFQESKITQIESNIEDFKLKGGSRSKVPYGPMEKTSESKLLERRKHQSRRYYEEIVKMIASADELLIFGPAEAKTGLQTYIMDKTELASKLQAIETADAMSLNQKIAWVKKFFKV